MDRMTGDEGTGQDSFLIHRVPSEPKVNRASDLAGVEPLFLTIEPLTPEDNHPVASNA